MIGGNVLDSMMQDRITFSVVVINVIVLIILVELIRGNTLDNSSTGAQAGVWISLASVLLSIVLLVYKSYTDYKKRA
jgi:hypothetical protein